MKCVILSGGEAKNYEALLPYTKDAFIICADSGVLHAKKMGLVADLAIGDFDSYEILETDAKKIITHPPIKDKTDTCLALEYALEKGFDDICLLFSLGKRFDHAISNVTLLKQISDAGKKGKIVDEQNEIYLLNGSITLFGKEGDYVSIIPIFGDAIGVSTKNLYYPLKNSSIAFGDSLGVSNRFLSDSAEITIKKGYALVIKSKDL